MRRSNVIALFIMFAAVSVFIVVMAFLGKNPKQTIASPTATDPVVILPTATPEAPDSTAAPSDIPSGTQVPTEDPTEEPTAVPVVRPVIDPSDFSDLSTKTASWGISGTVETDESGAEVMTYTIEKDAKTAADGSSYIYRMEADTEKKLYLTFNLGYEDAGKTTLKILDKLKSANVKAVFFASKNYLEENEDIVRSIIEQGHVVGTRGDIFAKGEKGNGMAYLSTAEFSDVMWSMEELYQGIAGENTRMLLYRPNVFSVRDMALAEAMGYSVVFWSFDYYDWDDKVDVNKALRTLKDNVAPGAIYQLSSSKVNLSIIEDFIIWARDNGYSFGLVAPEN